MLPEHCSLHGIPFSKIQGKRFLGSNDELDSTYYQVLGLIERSHLKFKDGRTMEEESQYHLHTFTSMRPEMYTHHCVHCTHTYANMHAQHAHTTYTNIQKYINKHKIQTNYAILNLKSRCKFKALLFIRVPIKTYPGPLNSRSLISLPI